jgi:Flp pilus assembly protein TadG
MKNATTKRLRLTGPLARLRALLAAFRSNKRGNVAIITALTALPLVAAVGCVVDYSTASLIKTKLQAAADAAALATISHNSSIITTAQGMSGNGAVSGGSTAAVNYFDANLTSAPADVGYTNLSPTGTVTRSGLTLTATVAFTAKVPTLFMAVMGIKNIAISGSSTASYTLPGYINFYLMLDVSGSMSFPSTSSEQQRLMAVNPDNLHGTNGYPQGCQFACHFAQQGTCAQTGSGAGPWQGSWPYYVTVTVQGKHGSSQETIGQDIPSQWPSGYPGGYCMGFIISRLGTTPVTTTTCGGSSSSTGTNDSNPPAAPSGDIPGTTNTPYPSGCGQYVNWNNSQVSSCPNPGTTSCIQLRADAVGYAVTTLLSQANTTETNDNITDQYQVGLFPFIQNLCTSSANSSNSCSVGLTTNLTGSTITTFAQQLASLLDNGQNATLGSGGTHFENALSQMNNFITSVGSGASSTDALPYVFIVTDGSQDYQTQSNGNWSSQNWSSSSNVPYQNSSTTIPQNPNPGGRNDQTGGVNSTDYCAAMKNRGITVAILYIPYTTISDPNSNFASNEDGYANTNISYIPASLQSCASPNFFFTANSPTDIQNALVTMFEQAISTAHLTN